MTSLLQNVKKSLVSSSGSDIGDRIDGLAVAVDAAGGRLSDEVVGEARTIVERAQGRLKLSADHTVVGIAGATGSGKSSTFNALTGLELSAVGVRRPTTSWATACVWGTQGARELLEWLGIPDRHQTTRDSMLDTRRESNDLDGVVLLDLPDHDSTEVSHHLEVDRLVVLVDMLVWVLDPQKYADAAIHDRYLNPLKTHDEVMVVVLNHIDTVPEERRESMIADVRRLLDNDGLQKVPVIPVSAKLGWGIHELKAEIAKRVAEKNATRARLEADVRVVAGKIEAESGSAPVRSLASDRVEALDDALAEAAGVPTIVDAVERATRLRANRATGWPLVSWVSRFKADPLKRLHLDLGSAGKELTGRARTSMPTATAVQRARVDSEVRALADDASTGLGQSWQESIRQASVSRVDDLNDRLDAALGDTDLGVARLPVWAGLVRVLQWLLILAAVGGGVWTLAALASGTLDDSSTPHVGGISLPIIVCLGGVLLGVVLALVCRILVAGTARTRAA
ncbi:YfjP family GTPase, partial [Nocardioides sp. CER28]